MSILVDPKRIWIWLKRIRFRKGYGVHSPFAFNLITWVIYEKYPYYKYMELNEVRRKLKAEGKGKCLNREKIDELLFRLVNRMQPGIIIEVGTSLGLTTLYLSQAKKSACCHTFDNVHGYNTIAEQLATRSENVNYHKGKTLLQLRRVLTELASVDFLYLGNADYAGQVFEICLSKATKESIFIIKGIHRTALGNQWWQKIVEDERVGVTFDLYEIGLVFFDKQKIKQHYTVNF